MKPPSAPANRRRPWLGTFAVVNALAAWGGAIGLIGGWSDFGDTINRRLPFHSLMLAGLALAVIVGVPLTVLAWCGFTGHSRTAEVTQLAGWMLIGWIVGQIAIIRAFSFFQPMYLAVGSFLLIASRWARRAGMPRPN